MTRSLVLPLALALFAGCAFDAGETPPAVHDTYSRTGSWTPRGDYALGTALDFDLRGEGVLRLESTDPSVLSLTGTRGVALGEGDAELVLFADEEEVLRHPVHVGAVERIQLRRAVLLPTTREVASPVRVIEGGEASVILDYYGAVDRRLFGVGDLALAEDASPALRVDETIEKQDRIALAPTAPGAGSARIFGGPEGVFVGTLAFEAVPRDEVRDFTLEEQPVSGDDEGAIRLIVVLGRDAAGEPVEGIRDAELFLDGEPLGVGGAVAFTPSDARPPVPLEVVWGGRSRTLEVRADNGATVF